jgi:hypothetical protein
MAALGLGLLIGVSCQQKVATAPSPPSPLEDSSFLPVLDLLKEDRERVISEAGGILQKTTGGSSPDSVFLTLEQFLSLSSSFLLPELDSARFQGSFAETSFLDESTGLLSFLYSRQKDSGRLKQVIVYISPGATKDQVDRISLDLQEPTPEGERNSKMTWKIKQYFMIVTETTSKNGVRKRTVQRVIWDPNQFASE